jgi:nucleotide-binding universal stress UspA family protein
MKKIIVPCDFSEPAIEAFKFAIDLAKKSKGSVLVVKVIDIPIAYEASFGMPTYAFNLGMSKELEKDAKKSFDKLQQKFGKGYKKVKFFVVHGPASMMIRDFIEEKKPDLVVMGTHGASGLQEFFVGSNTEKIVRFSKVPVFAIRKAIPVSKIKNIVFPTSLELNQTDFIKKLMVVQAFFKAKLHILFLNTPFNFVRDNELKEYASHFKFRNYTLNIRNDRYEPDGIIAFTNEVKADMLAMATHGRARDFPTLFPAALPKVLSIM